MLPFILIITMLAPSQPPLPQHHHHHHHHHHKAPSPIPTSIVNKSSLPSPSKSPAVDFSPPLIAMVVVVATAFVVVTYSRLIGRHLRPPIQRLIHRFNRRRRLPPSSAGDIESLQYDLDNPHVFSPYGLDESVIKSIPFSVYNVKYNEEDEDEESRRDCAVCLLEFEDDEYVRTLPVCSHTFHVDCIDAWLRSHANCPLCRAGVLSYTFTPLMAARIRPTFEDIHVDPPLHQHQQQQQPLPHSPLLSEITPCVDDHSPRRNNANSEDRFNARDFLLKRSYSFGFERSLPSERIVIDPVTASPWRYRRGSSSFWSKRPSPFGSIGKPRVFSFRYYRGMKSPFFRRRGFFPLSESSMRYAAGGSSSRRSKSIASPMFLRSSVSTAAFSSSRLRCGDPEALLSPDRFNRR